MATLLKSLVKGCELQLIHIPGTAVWLQPEWKAKKYKGGFWLPAVETPFFSTRSHLVGNFSFLTRRKFERGRRERGGAGRMGKDFLTEPGAATVRKDFFFFYAAFRGTLRPKRDFISQSAGTGRGSRRLFPEKRGKKRGGCGDGAS